MRQRIAIADRPRLPAEAADRRRADDRARRHGAGGHPAAARPRCAARRGLSVILITHDLGVMSAIADSVSVFYAGRIVESGATRGAARHAAPPVHAGAARRAAASGGSGRARAGRDRRRAADAARRGRPAARSTRAARTRSRVVPDRACRRARRDRRAAGCSRVRSTRWRGAVSLLELRDVEVVYRRRGREPVRAVAGVHARTSSAARSSGSSASRAAASRRSPGPRSASWRSSGGQVLFEGVPLTPLRPRARGRGARRGCRWSSRTRTRR